MICRKCGTENNDDNQFCLKCGTSLTPPKRGKTAWIIGSISALVLIAAIVLLFVFLPHAEELNGAWHNSKRLRFVDDRRHCHLAGLDCPCQYPWPDL